MKLIKNLLNAKIIIILIINLQQKYRMDIFYGGNKKNNNFNRNNKRKRKMKNNYKNNK